VTTFSFPSKTFLLGEYAVLEGDIDALLLAHAPYFKAKILPEANSPFHPASQAGRWLADHPRGIEFTDPHLGKGGFGGSGAEFLSAWFAGRKDPSTSSERATLAWQAWEASRKFSGSGADIFVQAYGVNRRENFFLRLNLARRVCEELIPKKSSGCVISLFHTGIKMPTHELKLPALLPMEDLRGIAARAASSLREGNFVGFAQGLQSYGDRLESLGLLAPHSAAALKQLRGKEGVLAAKGCGAMGSDVLLVAHRRASLESWEEENSLAQVGAFPV